MLDVLVELRARVVDDRAVAWAERLEVELAEPLERFEIAAEAAASGHEEAAAGAGHSVAGARHAGSDPALCLGTGRIMARAHRLRATPRNRGEGMGDGLMCTSAVEQAELVRSGGASAHELVGASLATIDRLKDELNAVVTRCD